MWRILNLIVKLFTKKNSYLRGIHSGLIIKNFLNYFIFRINENSQYSVHYTSLLEGGDKLILGEKPISVLKSLAVSGGCYISIFPGTTLTIGDGTIWSFNVCMQTGNHDFLDYEKYNLGSIKIGKKCWIAHAVTITAGVELGDNVIVGANTVVTKSFPSNVVIAGCPAKIIKTIN